MTNPCPHCGASLTTAATAKCPECGRDSNFRPFDHGPTAAAARATLNQPFAPPPLEDCLEYGGVRITATAIAELDGDRPLVTVKRANIERAALGWGRQSCRAFGLLVFGAVLILLGLTSALTLLGALSDGGKISSVWAWGTTLNILGCWAVYDAMRRGFFLQTDGPTGRQRLCFGRRARRSRIDEFLTEAERQYGYQIERELGPRS